MRTPEHEKLVVYHRVLKVVRDLEPLASSIPFQHSYLRLQLRRAFTSIAFNIAEGAGEFAPAEKARFYRIARRSATECMSILDVVAIVAPTKRDLGPIKSDLVDIASMLTAMVKRSAPA